MSTSSITTPPARPAEESAAAGEPVKAPLRSWFPGVAAGAAWLAAGAVTAWWPDLPDSDWLWTHDFAILAWIVGAVVVIAGAGSRWVSALQRIHGPAPWLIVLALFVTAWETVSAKIGLLPQPFFPPPQAILEVLTEDWARLGDSVLASLRLLAGGYLIGAAAGFATGVAVGWSRAFGYWIHPVLRFIGPLPATAWLPLAFFVFPSSFSASTFLIALATGFPVTVLTWSGVAGVNSAYYDIARTLGASRAFLIFKVAIPAAMPHVFVGLFMGLGNSFAVLVVAEMLGVKSGLGWYLQWAQGWASYANMYGALIVMALICSGLITLLFRVRDRLLSWQKGLVKW
jgi:NitT/TauT family transport system permease protein